MRTYALAVIVLLTSAAVAQSQPAEAPGKAATSQHSAHSVVPAAQLKWSPMPLPGCQMAAISGDPSAAGAAFTIRIKCADGTVIPAHWHPTAENVTILKGAMRVGMGDKFDSARLASALHAGDFISIPGEMRHFARANGETIMQVHGTGPFALNWVNPADVPQPPAKKSQ